jgi:hypothetical protein
MPKIVSVTQKGDFKKTDHFLHHIIQLHYRNKLEKYGEKGVKALSQATPRDSGATADSWSYEIVETAGRLSIYWKNSHLNNGVNIALILQYGHGTRNGGYVEGIDYINPAIRPILKEMANEVWKEVVSG